MNRRTEDGSIGNYLVSWPLNHGESTPTKDINNEASYKPGG